MPLFITTPDFDNLGVKNFNLESAATATINAALTTLAEIGYDTTLLRVKVNDGTTVRSLLQTNDIGPADLAAAVSGSYVLASASAIKTYIDNAVTGGQLPFSDFDASSQTSFPSGATLASRYRVTAAGTVQGVALQALDVFYPRVASPSTTTATDWIFVQGNADYATTSILGLVTLATLSEIQGNLAGNANKAITVAQLNAWDAALGRIKKYVNASYDIAIGSNTITHGLGSVSPVLQIRTSTGQTLVSTDFTVTDANTITFTASKARTANQVVVIA